jgi:hypothetical protein
MLCIRESEERVRSSRRGKCHFVGRRAALCRLRNNRLVHQCRLAPSCSRPCCCRQTYKEKRCLSELVYTLRFAAARRRVAELQMKVLSFHHRTTQPKQLSPQFEKSGWRETASVSFDGMHSVSLCQISWKSFDCLSRVLPAVAYEDAQRRRSRLIEQVIGHGHQFDSLDGCL